LNDGSVGRLLDAEVPGRQRSRHELALSRWASTQVCQVVHAQPCRDLAQPFAAGSQEAAEKPALAELLQSRPPALRAAPKPIEDPRELARNRGLSVAEQPAGVIDQEQISN
jgi:hypothetical protein